MNQNYFLKFLILEHKIWFLLTPLFDLFMICLCWQGPLLLSGQLEFICPFNAFQSSLTKFTVTASFFLTISYEIVLCFPLFGNSILSDWSKVSDSWVLSATFRRLHNLLCYILTSTMIFIFCWYNWSRYSNRFTGSKKKLAAFQINSVLEKNDTEDMTTIYHSIYSCQQKCRLHGSTICSWFSDISCH